MKIPVKKYWKIILAALICIVVILILSYVSIIGRIALNTKRSNSIKKGQIIENVDSSLRFFEARGNIIHNARLNIVYKLSRVFYEKDSDSDSELLNEFFNDAKIKDLIILDSNKTVKHIHGFDNFSISQDHFNDPYYDDVFADADKSNNSKANITTIMGTNREALFVKTQKGYWVYLFDAWETANSADARYFWELALENTWVGDHSFIGVTDKTSGNIIYCWDESLEGKQLDVSGDDSCWGMIDDDLYYISIYPIEEMSANVVAFTPLLKVAYLVKGQLITIGIILFTAISIMIALIIFLREDKIDPKEEISFCGKYFLKSQIKKYAAAGLAVSIVLTYSLILVSELDYLTNIEEDMDERIGKTVKLFDDYYDDSILIDNIIDESYYVLGRVADTFIFHHPEYNTKEKLRWLADTLGVSEITYYDSKGNTVITSSPLDHLSILKEKDSPLYELRYVLMGKEQLRVNADTRIMSEDISIYAVSARDDKGVADGIIAIEAATPKIERAEPRGLLQDRAGVIQFCVDEEGKILLFHDRKMIGKDVSVIGLSPDMIHDGYSGKFEHERKDYAALVRSSKAGFTALVQQYNLLSKDTVSIGLVSAVLFMIAAIIFAYDGLGSKNRFVGKTSENKGSNAGAKMKMVINFFIYCFAAYLIISCLLTNMGVEIDRTINYIISGDWKRAVNIFSVICNVFLIVVYYSIIQWFEAILMRVAAISGPSGETVSRLVANIIKYLGAIICLYQVTMNFGVDAKTALTSVGIAGFGLTFGAQDMIKDVIAGIFIFFEGNYKVGDMLLINGDRYLVKSIGIRATRVEFRGQVRVINNSQMSGAVNIQNSHELVSCEVLIGKEYDLHDIQEILEYELPLLRPEYPCEIPIPYYDGVEDIDAEGVKIRIATTAGPLYAKKISRKMREDVVRIMDKYGIRTPAKSYDIITSDMSIEDRDREMQKRAEAVKEIADKLREEKKG